MKSFEIALSEIRAQQSPQSPSHGEIPSRNICSLDDYLHDPVWLRARFSRPSTRCRYCSAAFVYVFCAANPWPRNGTGCAPIDLGRRLYYDAHLSENASVSCNSCHQLTKYGVDPGKPVSFGHNQRPGGRNSPTVYNAGLQFVQFWDGRAATLAEQASGPMMNPVEMGMSGPAAVLAYIRSRPDYIRQFRVAYPGASDPITLDHVTNAIAVFEAGLQTPARWDKYLQGDTSALSDSEKQGLRVFLRTGCAACHAGTAMGGNSYEQLGASRNCPITPMWAAAAFRIKPAMLCTSRCRSCAT